MFNTTRTKLEARQYLYDLTKYYRIWFSKNPDNFLGIENQLRLIRLRQDNPDAVIHFIYSSKLLSDSAIVELKQFCEKFEFNAIEFDSIAKAINDYRDQALYDIALEEIQRSVNNTGGNMAAAADCARLIVPLIEQCGIYTDFDVHSRLAVLGNDYVALRGPVLFPVELVAQSAEQMLLSPNSDFLACSIESMESPRLTPDALVLIRNLQREIITKYRRPFSKDQLFGNISLKELERYPELEELFKTFHQQYPQEPSIFDFRLYISQLPDGPAKKGQAASVKEFLTRVAVINVSGPGTYNSLFSHVFPKGCELAPTLIPFKDPKWLPFLQLYERCGTGYYNAIYDLVSHNNSIMTGISQAMRGKKQGRQSDRSWTDEGMSAKDERETLMFNSAIAIQGFWRRHKNVLAHHVLVKRVSRVCSEQTLLTPIKEEKYALALRKACAGLRLNVVKLLLQYHQSHPFNLNELSTTNPNTALDWALTAKAVDRTSGIAQREIIKILREAGAVSAVSQMEKMPSATL